jgi:hypothetical protein
MCEQCSAKTVSYGEVLPGVALVKATQDGQVMKAGHWGLVLSNDPFLIFSTGPEPDPGHGLVDVVVEATPPDHPLWAWLDVAERFRWECLLSPEDGHLLVQKGCEEGYDMEEDGYFAMWLFHRMGVLVANGPEPAKEKHQ